MLVTQQGTKTCPRYVGFLFRLVGALLDATPPPASGFTSVDGNIAFQATSE